MHLHPVGGVAGIEKVVARIVHSVGAVHAVEDVGAEPAGQQVVERVAGQPVAAARTDQALDGGELVAGRVAATRQRGLRVAVDAGEPHGHRRRRGLVAGEVEATLPVEGVGPAAALQQVIAAAAVEDVDAGIVEDGENSFGIVQHVDAADDVVEARAVDPGHRPIEEPVALGESAMLRRALEIDEDRCGG